MKFNLGKYYSQSKGIQSAPSDQNVINTSKSLTDQYEPTERVKTIIWQYKNYLASRLADDFISSIKTDWFLENNFSNELITYLQAININKLMWRLRYDACLSGEGFVFPFQFENDIIWENVNSFDIIWSQRIRDQYLSLAFYIVPIQGIFRKQFVVSFYANIILTLQVKLENGSEGPNKTSIDDDDNFKYYDSLVNKQPILETNNKLLLIHWPNNYHYEDIFKNVEWSLRILAQSSFNLIDDLQLGGVRIYKMSSDKYLNQNNLANDNIEFINQKYRYRNERQPIISKHADLTSPSAIGSFTPTSTVSAFDSNLIVKSKLWNEIVNQLNLFIVDSAKGSAQQHSTEILLQNTHAIQQGKLKINEMKSILVNWINLIINLKGFSDQPLTLNNLTFEYQLPFLDVLQQVSSVVGDSLNDS